MPMDIFKSNIDFNAYKTFYAVAVFESFSKAAEELCISQPSVSYSIKKLEDELNVTIFDRINTGMSLTEEGKLISEFAKKVLHEYEELKRDLSSVKNKHDITGDINVYINKIFETILTPDILKKSYSAYPNIKIDQL